MWQNAQEFNEALAGEYGPEEQEAALQFADESGLLAQWAADEDAEGASGYEDKLEEEFQRLEDRVGRKLTLDEEDAILSNISTEDRRGGVVPDFVAAYGHQVGAAMEHDAGRQHVAAAAAERAFREMGMEDQVGPARPVALEPENAQNPFALGAPD